MDWKRILGLCGIFAASILISSESEKKSQNKGLIIKAKTVVTFQAQNPQILYVESDGYGMVTRAHTEEDFSCLSLGRTTHCRGGQNYGLSLGKEPKEVDWAGRTSSWAIIKKITGACATVEFSLMNPVTFSPIKYDDLLGHQALYRQKGGNAWCKLMMLSPCTSYQFSIEKNGTKMLHSIFEGNEEVRKITSADFMRGYLEIQYRRPSEVPVQVSVPTPALISLVSTLDKEKKRAWLAELVLRSVARPTLYIKSSGNPICFKPLRIQVGCAYKNISWGMDTSKINYLSTKEFDVSEETGTPWATVEEFGQSFIKMRFGKAFPAYANPIVHEGGNAGVHCYYTDSDDKLAGEAFILANSAQCFTEETCSNGIKTLSFIVPQEGVSCTQHSPVQENGKVKIKKISPVSSLGTLAYLRLQGAEEKIQESLKTGFERSMFISSRPISTRISGRAFPITVLTKIPLRLNGKELLDADAELGTRYLIQKNGICAKGGDFLPGRCIRYYADYQASLCFQGGLGLPGSMNCYPVAADSPGCRYRCSLSAEVDSSSERDDEESAWESVKSPPSIEFTTSADGFCMEHRGVGISPTQTFIVNEEAGSRSFSVQGSSGTTLPKATVKTLVSETSREPEVSYFIEPA